MADLLAILIEYMGQHHLELLDGRMLEWSMEEELGLLLLLTMIFFLSSLLVQIQDSPSLGFLSPEAILFFLVGTMGLAAMAQAGAAVFWEASRPTCSAQWNSLKTILQAAQVSAIQAVLPPQVKEHLLVRLSVA